MRTTLADVAEALRRRIPAPLLHLVVLLRFHLAWARASVRADARAQMAFLLEQTHPEADLDSLARDYVRRQVWRGELRWHPELITRQPVVGIEHLRAARDGGRGVVLNFIHHGTYEGAFPSLARLGVPCQILVHPYMVREDTPRWLRQHTRVASIAGGTVTSAEIGTEGIIGLLSEGHVVAIASDVPGRTPLRFVGRDVLGSFGAARVATTAGSPVVVMTAEVGENGQTVRLHEPLDPADFESPQALLQQMLDRHEQAVLRWPAETDLPLSRWGGVGTGDD